MNIQIGIKYTAGRIFFVAIIVIKVNFKIESNRFFMIKSILLFLAKKPILLGNGAGMLESVFRNSSKS